MTLVIASVASRSEMRPATKSKPPHVQLDPSALKTPVPTLSLPSEARFGMLCSQRRSLLDSESPRIFHSMQGLLIA